MISSAFAQVLASGRPEFNRRAAEARRRYPNFDAAAFAGLLENCVDGLVQLALERAPDRVGGVAMAVYDVALELVGQGQGGPLAAQAWRELAPCYPALLLAQPARLLGMLTNAALHLERSGAARPAQWLALMAALAPQVGDWQQLAVVGQVCAWRAGMAHFRIGAIEAADALPEALALAAFGVGQGSWNALRTVLLADPWWTADEAERQRAQQGREFGSFSGFGGAFAMPPQVRPAADGFWVRSGDRYNLLVADACGVVLHGATSDEYEQLQAPAARGACSLSGQRLSIGRRQIELTLPAQGLAVTANQHTAAVTSVYSHAILLFPLR
ncbi:hypothetical protein GTP81_01930 [Rugamonas sp. FT107W]|uniref:Uncharacterized protein n=1 Tax=Duganella vulcania TaxID=2692166 RepID=A0A845HD10_9BURK|nr:hypothetical protein [Duganella vulcania]MYN15505.1 hypothetical protein [Duganella vulcania]